MNRTALHQRLNALPLPAWPTIVVLALGVRLLIGVLWWFVADSATNPLAGETYLYAGTDGYLQLAHTWLRTGEWAFAPGEAPVLHRPPMTGWLMALTTAWNPQYWFVNWLFVSLLLTLLSLFVFRRICRKLALAKPWQRLALLLFALHPMLAASVRATSFIQPGILMFLIVIALAMHARHQPTGWSLLILGGALAGAALTHGVMVLLLLIVPLWLAVHQSRWPTRLRALLLPLIVALVGISPWTIRNAQASDRWIPVVNGAGTQFWIARGIAAADNRLIHRTYAKATGDSLELSYYGAIDPAADAQLLGLAWQQKGAYWKEYLRGSYRFWVPVNTVYPAKRYVDGLLVLPIAVLWMAMAIGNYRCISLLSITTMTFWGVFAVFYPSTSYYLLVLPLILIDIAFYASTGEASTNSRTADTMPAAS